MQTTLESITRTLGIAVGLALITAMPAGAQTVAPPAASMAASPTATAASGYDQPPRDIVDVMRAPSSPVPSVSPTHDRMLLISWQDYPSIARVAAPFLRLAGVRIEPANHSRHDTPGGYGITPCVQALDLVEIPGGRETRIALPAGGCPGRPLWSADGARFAFENVASDSVELWTGDARTGAVHRVPGVSLNPMFDDQFQWMADQATLLVKLVPDGMGAPPAATAVPRGPSIQESGQGKGQSSTYEARDTLNNRRDEDVFEYYARSQLARVDAASGSITRIGAPALFEALEPAPDGRHVLVSAIHKPYSYVTTFERFPREIDVWDVTRASAPAVHHVASIPLTDRVPIHGVPLGPRDFEWRATEPATLIWAEALDGGDWNVKVPARDAIMWTKAPFDAAPVELARTEQRFAGFSWGEQKNFALMSEYDQNRHWRRVFIVDVDNPHQPKRILWDLSVDEKYRNPGTTVKRQLANGARVIRQDGDSIFLAGNGASTQGDRPFLDRLDVKTLATERLFRSDAAAFERVLDLSRTREPTFLTWHQSAIDPPNAFIRMLGAPIAAAPVGEAAYASTRVAVTHLTDPTPLVRQIRKRLVNYKRADGVDLSFTLYTPPGYREGTRVPAILYAYPLDYADAAQAGQVSGSQQTFTRLRLHRLLLLAGYALIDNASFPVVGDPKKAYDTYPEQLVADAQAAVDEAVRLGVVDPDRIGVTGHSHGALMTVNLLAQTNLFRAGVATSGSYNKTLTPFGFQSERRSVWEAPDVYRKVSPFFFADKVKAPLLIVHGAEDANPGTTPIQAVKMFEAVRGNGGVTRLVMLPNEPHWYTALESNEQLVYEMLNWFDKYVKNAPPR